MTVYRNITKTKQDGLRVKYVFSLMPEKIKKLCSRMTFRAWIHRTDPQKYCKTICKTFVLFEKLFLKENEPKNIFGTVKFQDYF